MKEGELKQELHHLLLLHQKRVHPPPQASSSSGAAGGAAKPPLRSRPRSPDGPPEWVTAEPPIGYKLFTSSCPDQRGTLLSSSAWMDENDQFLLSIIQGPAAAGSHISGWAQYLRRVTVLSATTMW